MRVLICGDRNWSDLEAIQDYVYSLPDDAVVIHGGAHGADEIAGNWAAMRGLDVRKFPALWSQYGRAAGPIRNQQMLDEGKPDLVVYFHQELDESRGTKDMVRRARKAKITVLNGGSTR